MFLLAAAAAAQTIAQTIAPPPSPPIVVSPPIVRIGPSARPTFAVAVEIRGGSGLLWSGTVRVGGDSQTSLSHHLSEPLPDCGPDARRRGAETNYSLTLYNRYDRDGAADPTVLVNASWTRSDAEGCALPAGSRTASFNQEAMLVRGRPVTLRGDGGLVVVLRRE